MRAHQAAAANEIINFNLVSRNLSYNELIKRKGGFLYEEI